MIAAFHSCTGLALARPQQVVILRSGTPDRRISAPPDGSVEILRPEGSGLRMTPLLPLASLLVSPGAWDVRDDLDAHRPAARPGGLDGLRRPAKRIIEQSLPHARLDRRPLAPQQFERLFHRIAAGKNGLGNRPAIGQAACGSRAALVPTRSRLLCPALAPMQPGLRARFQSPTPRSGRRFFAAAEAGANDTTDSDQPRVPFCVQSIVKLPAGVAGPRVEPAPLAPFAWVNMFQRCVRFVCAVMVKVSEAPVRNATVSISQALSATVVMLTLGLPLAPFAPFCASGVLDWFTPLSVTEPPTQFDALVTVALTVLEPAAGASKTKTVVNIKSFGPSSRIFVILAPPKVTLTEPAVAARLLIPTKAIALDSPVPTVCVQESGLQLALEVPEALATASKAMAA